MKYIGGMILFFLMNYIHAQKQYSLQECIDLAKKNSSLTKLAALDVSSATLALTTAKQNKLPSASAGIGHGLNFGRSIDPSSNSFINQQITRGGFNGQAYVPIWQANQLNHSVKQFQFAEEAGKWALKNEEANLELRVTVAYLFYLNTKELNQRADIQVRTTLTQLDRLKTLLSQGVIVPNLLSDMEGQLALDQTNQLNSRQDIRNARLSLCQLMNIPYDENMDLVKEETSVTEEIIATGFSANAHPLVKFREYQIKSAETGLLAAKANRYPQFGVSFNLGSNYSSAFTLNNEKVGYPRQLSNNFNYSGLLSLSIPLLDGYRVRRDIDRAKIDIDRAKTSSELAKNTIQQQIEEAKLLAMNANEKLALAQSQVISFEKSFKIAETRFNNGVTNSTVEYIIAKNNFDRSQNVLITARYELAFRKKVLEFYSRFKE